MSTKKADHNLACDTANSLFEASVGPEFAYDREIANLALAYRDLMELYASAMLLLGRASHMAHRQSTGGRHEQDKLDAKAWLEDAQAHHEKSQKNFP